MKAASSSILLSVGFRNLLSIPNFGSLLRHLALAQTLYFLLCFKPSSSQGCALPLCHFLQIFFPDSPSRTYHCLLFSLSPAPCRFVLPNLSPACGWRMHPCIAITHVPPICSVHQFLGHTSRLGTTSFFPLQLHMAGRINSDSQRQLLIHQ